MMFKKIRRRKFPRVAQHYLLQYKVISKDKVLAFARDLSAGGVLFHSKEELPVGGTVELWFNLPFHPEPIKAVAKILRVKPLQKIGGFDVAVEFINIEEKHMHLLNNKIITVTGKEQGKAQAKGAKVVKESGGW